MEHVLPAPQMQPIWEMVKTATGQTDFGLSYHRGRYQKDYDDYHDIYLQRWRLEDKPWEVYCVNRYDSSKNYSLARGNSTGANYALCPDPDYYKVVLGQGYDDVAFTADGVSSRFKDPLDANNSAWRPDSVPAVKAQPWQANYKDGACGIRHNDEDYDLNDPMIPHRSERRAEILLTIYVSAAAANPRRSARRPRRRRARA